MMGELGLAALLSLQPGAVEIAPRGGPVGTEVAIQMAGLPAAMELTIGMGAPRSGYEWVAEATTNDDGSLSTRVRVPDWARPGNPHYFFVTLPETAPFGTSPAFHVTSPEGLVRVSGVVTGEGLGRGYVALRGEHDDLYCLRGRLSGARAGAEISVQGVLGEATTCPDGIPVNVRDEARPRVLELWESRTPAFGIYLPVQTEPEVRELAANPIYDFFFLDQERDFDPEVIQAAAAGVHAHAAGERPTLLVRIPSLYDGGETVTRARMEAVLALGGDGIVLPHVRSLAEAEAAIGFLREAGASVWSPSNPGGDFILMIMLEAPETVGQAEQFAALSGYSVLACGIGSLRSALGGDQEGAEAGARRVLEAATNAGLADMITANPASIAGRVAEGYLALLMSGPTADEAIRVGREAAGRP